MCQHSDLVCHDLIEKFFGTVGRCVSVDPEPSCHIDGYALFDLVKVLYVPSAPCDDVVPHAFIYGSSFARLVEKIRNHCEVDYLASVVLIGTYCSDVSLELDPVDVFDVFHDFDFIWFVAKEAIPDENKCLSDASG